MKKKIFTIVLIVLPLLQLSAQEAVVSGGGYYHGESRSISWTLGELVIETLRAEGYILTQGLQQSMITIVAVEEIEDFDFDIFVYPIPATDFLTISVRNHDFEHISYRLYDVSGRLLVGDKLKGQTQELSLRSYDPGIYFLRISVRNQLVKTFKILKQ